MTDTPIERHPWPPFIPEGARILILGTFPPGSHRWSMNFYYPNRTNDFWKIIGLIFCGDAMALIDSATKQYDQTAIRRLLAERHIALGDTAREVRRLRGNASDKYLEIVTPLPLMEMLKSMPQCHTLATTGEKAASVIASLTGTAIPRRGGMIRCANPPVDIWRMPSTSRAYPLPLEEKAKEYARMFRAAGILPPQPALKAENPSGNEPQN